ncbi:uncharacterized protein N7459_002841 [Penicillium hispanicum]|uniref:uncharacterized protein n=1 Tax=Penicillium hispanicum TaxID=1080232 RepID=UPI0025419D3A|nr:uncharacterized protein N7459_002841 [Penicillium hispanicum]KAJ5587076.1 hypothetical protein N7459_002841 [Penicillium hispanicum]
MVGLKKLFQADRSSSRPSSSEFASDEPYFGAVELPAEGKVDTGYLSPEPLSPAFPSPGLKASRSLDVAHHFDQIEKQFEDLHQYLGDRPLSSQSQYPPAIPGRSPVLRQSNARHIDLMDALSASERNQELTPRPLSPPTSPYNEDVAERNMTRFLRIQHRSGFASSRILSALYQEDVADRNIAKYGGPSRSLSSLSCRSSPAAPGRVRNLSPDGQNRKRNPGKPNWTSEGDLRNRSSGVEAASLQAAQASGHLRLQRSEPSFSADDDGEEAPPPPAVQRLGVPPVYKQGRRWSNTPLPDSPTLPAPLSESGDDGDGKNKADSPPILQPPSTTARSSSLMARSLSPSPSPGLTSRKNVRDLSINTQLAAKGRPKIAHRAIQPPTPSNFEMKRTPSIAEVMNSPLPATSPAAPSPRFKVSEMMDMFNKAYLTTQSMNSHPSYETLQDAIVREINSHEAFRSVPVPAAGPLFTPTPGHDTFDEPAHPGLNRSVSAGQFSKIMRKGSFKKHKRNSESRRSISISVPSKSYDKILRRVSPSPRRRHTDAPAPSPGLLADIQEPNERGTSDLAVGEPLTYMDVLYRAGNEQAFASGSKSTPITRKRGRSESAATISAVARGALEPINTPSAVGTVYCMQAHSTPSKDSRSSVSGHEESDDEIIHLPSVGAPPPRVQIEGVDDNNVRYVIDSGAATDAQRLMDWPQRVRRTNSPQPTSSARETNLSPLARARMQLRGTRSVETY